MAKDNSGTVMVAFVIGALTGAAVGGASDGNLTAGAGTPTLDGLGAVGGGAHAADEHVLVDELAPRAALVAALVADLLADLVTGDRASGVPAAPGAQRS